MIHDINYYSKVFRKIIIFLFSIFCIFLGFKLAIFYIPFLIAFIISNLIEPLIRFCMKHFKLKRRTSSIIIFIIVLSIIGGLLSWGIISLISESSNLLNNLNVNIENITSKFQKIISKIDLEKINLSNEIVNTVKNSGEQLFNTLGEWIKNVLTTLLNVITSIPTIGIYTAVCLISLYFICTDKIYMIDQIEHHFPEKWVKKFSKYMKRIIKSLGCYLKAQCILIVVSFIICLIGLYILKIVGLNVKFPLVYALGIGFVDALPIFGSGTVIIPWAIIVAFNGDITLAICLIILLSIMSIVRQCIEPKIVSGQIGIHPIFTLISMYTGFKLIGVFGMLIGPIILIILKEIFSNMLDKGLAKSIFEREI